MSYTTLKESTPTARKPHTCILCERDIEIGEKHRQWVGLNYGQFCDARSHVKCESFRLTLDLYDDEMPDPSEFRDAMDRALNTTQPHGGKDNHTD